MSVVDRGVKQRPAKRAEVAEVAPRKTGGHSADRQPTVDWLARVAPSMLRADFCKVKLCIGVACPVAVAITVAGVVVLWVRGSRLRTIGSKRA